MIDVAATVGHAWDGPVPDTLLGLIEQGPAAWRRLDTQLAAAPPGHVVSHGVDTIHWHAPIPRPRKNIVCLGQNYAAHIREAALARGHEPAMPKAPAFFSKMPTTVSGPFDDVLLDESVTRQMDWEAELGVIIGIAGRNIAHVEALTYVFGYTVVNDFTARDLQARHGQSFKGKSLDGFCPMGPVVVTADQFGDPQHTTIALRVNGVEKQRGNTNDMVFSVAHIISTFSQGLTLEPGDILSTGTPSGVGFGRTPQEFLQPGDLVETDIEGIGTMRNRIRAIRDLRHA